MLAPLAKFIDWSAIQIVALRMPVKECDPRLDEAVQFLNGPDFVAADSSSARLQFNGPLHFHFPTPRPCEFTENNVVHGRLYRCGERWHERPVIILLHGWGDSGSYYLRFPLLARRCNRAGFNAATLVTPYDFQRRPRQRAAYESGDCVFWAHRAAQGIAEIRALTGWMLGEGCPAVALWGYSMGAIYAGMTICCDARLAAVVMASVPGRCTPWVQQHAVRPRIRANLQSMRARCERMNLTSMNLTLTQPAIPRENILLIEGIHDLICPKDDIENLWQSWGQPEIWRLPYGHVSVCCGGVPGLPKRVLRWLAPRFDKQLVHETTGA
ncbi:MAG TPA: alpha/beta fold hydrolase [Verrucomicrobiae bacterium]|nr:alpha/beta fold hydrolase [Verrucomicrobiae bacterium]